MQLRDLGLIRRRPPVPKIEESLFQKDIWPHERSVIEAPHRLAYVRRLVRPKGCVFCKALEGGPSVQTLLLFKNTKAMVILNKYPYNNGHILVLPVRHISDFTSLDREELSAFYGLTQSCLKILKRVYNPQGFNMGVNLGAVAGAGLPDHLHGHIIPRWSGDTNFLPLVAETKLIAQRVEDSYQILRPHFQDLEEENVI